MQSRMETRFELTRAIDDAELLSLSHELDRLLFCLLAQTQGVPLDASTAPMIEPG